MKQTNVGSRVSFGNLLYNSFFKFLRIFCLNIIFNGFYVSQCYSTDIFTKINVSDFNQKKVLTTPFIQTILTHKLQVPFLLYVIGVGYILRGEIISEGLLYFSVSLLDHFLQKMEFFVFCKAFKGQMKSE